VSDQMTTENTTQQVVTPLHKWTNGGDEVLLLKFVGADGLSYSGADRAGKSVEFKWPLEVGAVVEAPDLRDDDLCGGGLHGWAWGHGVGTGKEPDWQATWIVFGCDPQHVRLAVQDKPKCIGPCTVRFVGGWHAALHFVLPGRAAWSRYASSGSASNSRDGGSASNSGYSGSASNSGYSGSASNSGDSGSASNSGDSGSASTAHPGTAAICTGLDGRAKAAAFGCVALAWWNSAQQRAEMRCSLIGEGGLKADTWYRLNDAGEFVEEE